MTSYKNVRAITLRRNCIDCDHGATSVSRSNRPWHRRPHARENDNDAEKLDYLYNEMNIVFLDFSKVIHYSKYTLLFAR